MSSYARLIVVTLLLCLSARSARADITVIGTPTHTHGDNTTTTLTVTVPAGAQQNDLLVVPISRYKVPGISPPSDHTGSSSLWNTFANDAASTGSGQLAVYFLYLDSGSPAASYAWTFSAGSYPSAGMIVLRGTKTSSIVDGTRSINEQNAVGSPFSMTATTITPTLNGDFVLLNYGWAAAAAGTVTLTLPGGFTAAFNESATYGNHFGNATAYIIQSSAGPVGDQSGTGSASFNSLSQQIALEAAATPAGVTNTPTVTPTVTPTATPTLTPTNTPIPWYLAAQEAQSTPIRTPLGGTFLDTWTHNETPGTVPTPFVGDEEWAETGTNPAGSVEYDFCTQEAMPGGIHAILKFFGFYSGNNANSVKLQCSANESTYYDCAVLTKNGTSSEQLGCDLTTGPTGNTCINASATPPTPCTHIRLSHSDNGNATHRWYVDQVELSTASPTAPTHTATVTPTSTETPTASPTGSETETPTVTPTGTATPTDTATLTPTATMVSYCDEVPTPTGTATDTATETPTGTETPTSTDTPTPTITPTETPPGVCGEASATATGSPTASPTGSLTSTTTPTSTDTPTRTATPTPSVTPTCVPQGGLCLVDGNCCDQPCVGNQCTGPTFTPTPTPSETPTGLAGIVGSVTLQRSVAAPDPVWSVALTVTLFAAGDGCSGTVLDTFTPTTDTSGAFLVVDAAAPGSYDICVKNRHTLRRLAANVALSAGVNVLNFGTLLEGDATNDNLINGLDLSLWRNNFQLAPGAVGCTTGAGCADFNEDGVVNGLDLSLWRSNFQQAGQ